MQLCGQERTAHVSKRAGAAVCCRNSTVAKCDGMSPNFASRRGSRSPLRSAWRALPFARLPQIVRVAPQTIEQIERAGAGRYFKSVNGARIGGLRIAILLGAVTGDRKIAPGGRHLPVLLSQRAFLNRRRALI